MERFGPGEELLSLINFIGFDIDGVLADSRESGTDKLNRLLNTNFKSKDITAYDQVMHWARQLGKSDEEAYAINRSVWDDPEVLSKATLVNGAFDLLKFLYDQGMKPPIITTRISSLKKTTYDWIKTNLPFIDDNTIFVGEHSNIRDGLSFKIDIVKKQGISWFVEDHPETAEAIINETDANVFMIAHPFNMHYQIQAQYISRIHWIRNEVTSAPTLVPILNKFRLAEAYQNHLENPVSGQRLTEGILKKVK
jgi:uncharacterized HAD superfamily protein